MQQSRVSDTPVKPGTAWRVEMLGGLRAVPTQLLTLQGDEDGCPSGKRESAVVEQFRTHKTALLLARLALFSHRTHAREELADLLWPDASTERGRAYLTKSLVYLRQALHEPRTGGLFVADHRVVRVTRGLIQTDVSEWEATAAQALASVAPNRVTLLSTALGKYTGDLLPGFYDDWVCDERSRLAALRDALQARLETLAAAPEGTGDPSPKAQTSVETGPPRRAVANAPLYLTRFFGRESESEGVCRLLRGKKGPPVRLITLLGMGGIGKTRLALQIAQSVLGWKPDDGADGGFGWGAFVPLAEARTGTDMENGIVHALGVHQSGAADGLATSIISHLNSRIVPSQPDQSANRLLLILDNLEQLGEAAAPVVSRLLSGVPGLTILTTSRQPVQIPGEQEILLGPLPGSSSGTNPGTRDDMRLFVDRARLVRPSFVLTGENEPVIDRLCALLEGVPLALELAAAWVRILPPAQIAERLSDRFALLASRDTATAHTIIPQRHRSLHAAIAWSYELLEPDLRVFFAQFSVFHGGWTTEAAQVVTGAEDVHEPLLLLAERSLIQFEESSSADRPPRYRMLESLRAFADEQLSPAERESLTCRHARYFDDLSRIAAQPKQAGMPQTRPLLPDDRENLYAAIFSGLKLKAESPQSEEHLVHSLHIVLQSSWLWTPNEQKRLLTLALGALPRLSEEMQPSLKIDLLLAQGVNFIHLGEFTSARQCLEEGRAVCEASGNLTKVVKVKSRLGNLAAHRGDLADAVRIWTECLEEARCRHDESAESALLNNLAVASPDLADRRRFGERAVALSRLHRPGSHILASSLNTLATAAIEQRDFQTARVCLEEARELARADGARGMLAVVLANLVQLAIETGEQLEGAQELLDAAQAAFEAFGEPTRVTEVQYIRFRLAIAQDDADKAVDCACRYMSLSQRDGLDAAAIAAIQADLTNQLRTAGFDAHSDKLSALPLSIH